MMCIQLYLLTTIISFVQLGARRRLGFKQKGLSSLSVQRSEEIVPDELARHLVRQLTATDSFTDSGNESGSQ